jgi:hypothetical protein
MPMDMIDDEGEGMKERQNEESIGDPSMEDLEPLM